MTAVNARSFWERKVADDVDKRAGHALCTLGRPRDVNNVWDGIYCTIRDRRRSRSRTSTSSIPRSRTPSSVSSGRTTPSPGLSASAVSEEMIYMSPETPSPQACCLPYCKCKYQVACRLVPRSVPVQYSSTVIVQLGSKKRRYLEEITFQKRLVPRQFSESMEVATEPLCRCYTSEVTIPCQPPLVNIISLEAQQQWPDNDTQPLITEL